MKAELFVYMYIIFVRRIKIELFSKLPELLLLLLLLFFVDAFLTYVCPVF